MALVPDQLPNDVAALQVIIAKQAKEPDERAVAKEETKLKARDVIIEQRQLNLDKLKRSSFARPRRAGLRSWIAWPSVRSVVLRAVICLT